MATFPTLRLSDGNEIPMLGYGLGSINMAQETEHADIVKRTLMAIDAGYHHLDCAQVYGNEAALGEAVETCRVPREKLFLTTKVLGTAGQDVDAALTASLDKLRVDYVDLYLIHVPFIAPGELPSMWAQMERVKASGRARSIGVSNFLQPHLESILATATTKPAVNQIEYHPYLQHGGLVDFCRQSDVAVVAYSPLTAITKARPGPVDDVYAELASRHGVNEADVALRWCLDQGLPVVTTSSSRERLDSYRANVARFKLSEEEVKRICEVGRTKHYRAYFNDFFAADDRS